MNKVIIKEIKNLTEKLAQVEALRKEKIEENIEREAEYAQLRSEQKIQIREIGKCTNDQQIKLDGLESEIEDYQVKLEVLKRELNSLEITHKEECYEFEKLKTELLSLKNSDPKKIESLKAELQSQKEGLKREMELEIELEKNHKEKLNKAAKDYEKKLGEAEKKLQEKFEKANEMYKKKAEPLLRHIEDLDTEIKNVENKICNKQKQLETLKITYESLTKEYENISASNYLYESKLILKSLKDALKYLDKQPENLTDDVILGIFIVKANLQWIINRLEYSSIANIWFGEGMKELLNQCRNIIALHKSESVLLVENLWKDEAGNLKHGFLNPADNEFFLPKFNSCQSIATYMMEGTPKDSDLCLNDLVSSKCEVSDYCWLSEVNGDAHSGYKTSHRLLYFQFAYKIKCHKLSPKKFSGISEIKNKLCQQMLLEAVALFESSSFFLSQDLFMEQIALCGFEGYEEFATSRWRDQVRSWQNDFGCFGKGVDFKNCSNVKSDIKNVERRDCDVDECHSHVTAVAISALAFFLRVTLNRGFNFD